MRHTLILFCAAVAGLVGRYAAGGENAVNWTTVACNMERTNWSAACPDPPYRFRWVWANGAPLDAAKVQAALMKRLAPIDLLPRLITTRFMGLAQPVVKDGTAYIGSVEGALYAIDVRTGATNWSAKTSGPVCHSATIGDTAVFVATLGGLDAFDLAGRPVWRFKVPGDGFWTCPAVWHGRPARDDSTAGTAVPQGSLVLAGSIGGTFYALDAATGKPKWTYPVGATIYHSPAVHENAVLFGAENMHAYSLDIATGKLNWENKQTFGSTFGHYWPVVAAKHGTVIFCTNSLDGIAGGYEAVNRAPADYEKSQEALRAYYKAHPDGRNFYALDLRDGREKVFVATGQFTSGGDVVPLPVVRPDGSVLAMNFSREGAFLNPGEFKFWGKCVDVGELDFATGFFKRLGPTGSKRQTPDIHRADGPTTYICGGGDYLMFFHQAIGFYVEPLGAGGVRWPGIFGLHWSDLENAGGQGGIATGAMHAGWAEPAILGDVIVSNAFGVCVAAYESAKEK